MEGKCFLHVKLTYCTCVYRVSAAQQAAKTANTTGQARAQASITVSKGPQQHVTGQSSNRHSMMGQRRYLCILDMIGQGRADHRADRGSAEQGKHYNSTDRVFLT